MAELSARTGVPVPTIKYYIREGLLARGRRTSANQATYDDAHVRRINLIRALVEVGGFTIARLREIIALLDQREVDVDRLLGRALSSIGRPEPERDDEHWQRATHRVEELVRERGWRHDEDGEGTRQVTEVIAILHDVGHEEVLELLDMYAEAMERIAVKELELVSRLRDPQAILEAAVVGTVLGEALLAGLRRMAHADTSARRFAPDRLPPKRASQSPSTS